MSCLFESNFIEGSHMHKQIIKGAGNAIIIEDDILRQNFRTVSLRRRKQEMRNKSSISAALAKQTSHQGVRRQPFWKLHQFPSNSCSVPKPELGKRCPQYPSRLVLTPDDPSPLPACLL